MDKKVFWKKAGAGIVIAAVGLLMIIVGIIVTAIAEPIAYKETTARIVDISEEKDHVFVLYDANGTEYRSELNYYTSAYNVGMEVKAIYDPKNPSDIRVKGANSYIYFLMAVGVMFVVIGGVFVLIGLKKKKTAEPSDEKKEAEQK